MSGYPRDPAQGAVDAGAQVAVALDVPVLLVVGASGPETGPAVVCSAGGVVCDGVALPSFGRTALGGAGNVKEPRLFVVAVIRSGTDGVVSRARFDVRQGSRWTCRPALPTIWVAAASRAPAGGAASAEAPGGRRAPLRRQFARAGGECLRACVHERFR